MPFVRGSRLRGLWMTTAVLGALSLAACGGGALTAPEGARQEYQAPYLIVLDSTAVPTLPTYHLDRGVPAAPTRVP